MRLVIAAFPQVEFETWEQCKRYLPQVYVCLDLINQHGIHIAEAASRLYRAGWYLNDRIRNAEAEPILWQALAIHEETLGTEHLSTAATLNNLGELYCAQGRYGEAELLLQQALTIYEQTLGPEHPDTATTFYNLAELYKQQGRYQKAEPLISCKAMALKRCGEGYCTKEASGTLLSMRDIAEM